MDDIPVRTESWSQQFTSQSPPPIAGTFAWAIMDQNHYIMIVGTQNPSTPLNLKSVHVWQVDSSNNLHF